MDAALDDVEFLALSANRVAVLRALAEGSRSRSDLAAETGASQATLGRILSDFEDRSWVRRAEGAYEATATGRLVADAFSDLLEALELERDLRDIVAYLPTEELGFDLARLTDATITVPTGTRPNAPVQRLLDLQRDAADVRAFSHAFNEQTLSLTAERAAAGDVRFRGVFSPEAVEALTDDAALRRHLLTLVDADDAAVRVRSAGVPVAGTVADGRVHLLVRDDSGVLRASIDTDDDTVREWADDAFERYWAAATPLDRDDVIASE
ncbi:helix-turn-helix transcriptional regulator [Halosimplex pelagicum]|uniref:ArsR family transcriptional regulator n=1 Tax=Halosimplex pelagicum TaxID=869886 RepID=A0A7D5P9Z7_9EURY|nr:ArsR family transcriptional regulator [Halosimplex pelagicum]QLH84403.1 ArsR family transcriptional regulator [Halosimplex pelagicum]